MARMHRCSAWRCVHADLQAAGSVGATSARPERSIRGLTDGGIIGQLGATSHFRLWPKAAVSECLLSGPCWERSRRERRRLS
jgi:hypothetical protein